MSTVAFQSLMVQGTTSDAGKSTLVTALCRALARRGIQVAPFKPQNMALNSAVAAGGEIGRAQAIQAQACGIDASVHMNPVLIKPSSDIHAQIIIQGQVFCDMSAKSYHDYKTVARSAVLQSFQHLTDRYQSVVIEGAGSPAEINLREGDIANMGFAEAVDCPVILVADIDRGGVFAHIVGTLALLSQSEQDRIVGFVINRFRGDIGLLQDGLDWLEARTGKPVLAVLPYLQDWGLSEEDGINVQQTLSDASFKVVVPVLPRISHHTDFDGLRLNPRVDFQFVSAKAPPPPCDLMILPGSKNVREDLETLRQSGWPAAMGRHLRYGGKVLGICGGYQMLGQRIRDPEGVEGVPGEVEGLNLLPVVTDFNSDKHILSVSGSLHLGGEPVNFEGYEIHHGFTQRLSDQCHAPIQLDDHNADGCLSEDDTNLKCN